MNTEFILYFVVPLSLGFMITIAGAILLFTDSRRRKKEGDIDIEDWFATGGKVISAKLSKRHEGDTYEPIIKYVYTVDGIEYHGKRVFPHQKHPLSKKDPAQDIIDRHPQNAYVSVRYNPENPSDSALEATPHPMNYIVIAGWILTGLGISSCCFTSFMAFIIFSVGLSY